MKQVNTSVVQSTIQNFSAAKYGRGHSLDCQVPRTLRSFSALSVLSFDSSTHETARVDALIAAKMQREVLDLLAEKRKAIIATAVTRGLDPKVKLRDSGVPWLGEIPAHWERCTTQVLGGRADGLRSQ
jgi:type I restriction enzyme S subunit